MALSGQLTDKPGLTARMTLVLVKEKLAAVGEVNPRVLPNAEAFAGERIRLPLVGRVAYPTRLDDYAIRGDSFVGRYATILFRSKSNFV